MRGRKPTPTTLKLLKGNPGHRPINDAEPKPAKAAKPPAPPRGMNHRAKTHWRKLAKQLHATGLLTVIDEDALARYCNLHVLLRDAQRTIEKQGFTTISDRGNEVQHPAVMVADKCISQLNRLAAEFGMTPSSRSRVVADDAPGKNKATGFQRVS